ncbi:MAG: hypothetical protein V3V99_09865 [candidate division Zixibacteria bacterium]
MNRKIFFAVVMSFFVFSSMVLAQYEDEPYVEGFVGGNFTSPSGYMKNDLVPDSLNATGGLGFIIGGGYYFRSNLILGLYFSMNNMGANDIDLNHRVFDFGIYTKYFIKDLSESSFSPYVKVSGGLAFSKLITKVTSNGGVTFRELSYSPALGVDVALGLHWKTNEYGALYFEGGYKTDLMDGVTGEFKGVDYPWLDNNNFLIIRAGVIFNIGPKE